MNIMRGLVIIGTVLATASVGAHAVTTAGSINEDWGKCKLGCKAAPATPIAQVIAALR